MTTKATKTKGGDKADKNLVPDKPVDMAEVKLRVQGARIMAAQKMPYLSVALFAMTPVFTTGVPILASDAKWRIYYNPNRVMSMTVEELAGAILHEVNHCLRNHGDRFDHMNEDKRWARVHNIAGDMFINHDLKDDKITMIDGIVYMDTIKKRYNVDATREMTTEQVYYLIKEKIEENCTCGKTGLEKEQPQDSDKQDGDQGGEQEGEGSGSGEQEGEGSGDEDSDKQGKGKKGKGESKDGEGDEEGEGSGDGDKDSDKKGKQGKGSGKGQTSEEDCPVHGHNHSSDGSGEPCEQCDGIPDCGSAADGVRRDYEEDGEKESPGVDSARGDLLRRHTAIAIKDHVKNRGTVPAGFERWADEIIDPVVDWRKVLATIVRKSYAQVAGKRDFTYSRPSRRQASMRQSGSNIVLPAMRQPAPPRIAIVIDTSGSMSDTMLKWALAETQGVLRSIGSSARDIKLVSCDAAASSQRIRQASQIQLQGGGGTDMRVGIEEAMQGREKPQVVIVLTDGYTPWPDEPLKGGVTLIVGLTDEESRASVPEWARTVIISQ